MPEVMNRASQGFGDWLRSTRARRLRLRRRSVAVAAITILLGATVIIPPRPRLVWNASASAPIGLYGIDAPHDVRRGDMVIARLPSRLRDLAAQRRYIPANVPLVKQVAGAPGDTICAWDRTVFVNGQLAADRKVTDAQGRLMPWWNGCITLREGAIFLLMDDPASFDGRYFGPTGRADILGLAKLLWAR